MGLGLGRGFGRGPWGLGLKSGVGWASKVTWRALNGQTKLMPPTQAPPYPMGVGLSLFSHVNSCPPNPHLS
ncbi:hypothetical protein HanPSC8_Chr02g0079931 [Helianthus annuus]|nr:hypothetical protein HanPSC8_Chr02g0079931 [Helianthus annuus]